MNEKRKVELGHEVSDEISGFTGTVIGIVDYITGCKQVLVQPSCTDSSTWKESHWIDVDRLQVKPTPQKTFGFAGVSIGGDKEAPRK